jgi:hypothetical protein
VNEYDPPEYVPPEPHVCDFRQDSQSEIEQCTPCGKYWQRTESGWAEMNRLARRAYRDQLKQSTRSISRKRDGRLSKWSTKDRADHAKSEVHESPVPE